MAKKSAPTRKAYEINVVSHEDELLFKRNDILFGQIHAQLGFENGEVRVYRAGELFDQTSYINWHGTHGAAITFFGLRRVFGIVEPNVDNGRSELESKDFQEGDLLVLEVPDPEENDFDWYLKMLADFVAEENPGKPVVLWSKKQQD